MAKKLRCYRYRLYDETIEEKPAKRMKPCRESVAGTRPFERWTKDGRLVVDDVPYCAEHLADQDRILAVRTTPDELTALRAQVAALRAALAPFAYFAEQWDAKPINGISDEFYGIHVGTEWEAVLRISECGAARAALALTDAQAGARWAAMVRVVDAARRHCQAERVMGAGSELSDALAALDGGRLAPDRGEG